MSKSTKEAALAAAKAEQEKVAEAGPAKPLSPAQIAAQAAAAKLAAQTAAKLEDAPQPPADAATPLADADTTSAPPTPPNAQVVEAPADDQVHVDTVKLDSPQSDESETDQSDVEQDPGDQMELDTDDDLKDLEGVEGELVERDYGVQRPEHERPGYFANFKLGSNR